MLDPLQWKDGWPEVENSIPSDSHDSPVFNQACIIYKV